MNLIPSQCLIEHSQKERTKTICRSASTPLLSGIGVDSSVAKLNDPCPVISTLETRLTGNGIHRGHKQALLLLPASACREQLHMS